MTELDGTGYPARDPIDRPRTLSDIVFGNRPRSLFEIVTPARPTPLLPKAAVCTRCGAQSTKKEICNCGNSTWIDLELEPVQCGCGHWIATAVEGWNGYCLNCGGIVSVDVARRERDARRQEGDPVTNFIVDALFRGGRG